MPPTHVTTGDSYLLVKYALDTCSGPDYKRLQYIFIKRRMRGWRWAFGELRLITGCTVTKTISMEDWQLPAPRAVVCQEPWTDECVDWKGTVCWSIDESKTYEQHFGNLTMVTRVKFIDLDTIKQEKLGKGWKKPGIVCFNMEGFEGGSDIQKWCCRVCWGCKKVNGSPAHVRKVDFTLGPPDCKDAPRRQAQLVFREVSVKPEQKCNGDASKHRTQQQSA